jgi:hypothetical protein
LTSHPEQRRGAGSTRRSAAGPSQVHQRPARCRVMSGGCACGLARNSWPWRAGTGGVPEHSPAGHARQPSVPAEPLAPGCTHLQSEAPPRATRQSGNAYDFVWNPTSQAASPARPPVSCPQRTSGPALRPSTCRSRARRHSTVPGRSRGLCLQSRRSPWHARTGGATRFGCREPPPS